MAVRRLRAKQRGPFCSYCPPKTTRATYRGMMFSKFACSEHVGVLKVDDAERERQEECFSEADFELGLRP